ncbi:MAG TPA: EamA family transporter [Methylomirabilota bacterium]|nr:EamA family transporter [Methylomirabilota bacterium]
MTRSIAVSEGIPQDRKNVVAGGSVRVARAFGQLPPTVLLLLSMLSIQLGSALATTLFSSLGPAGTAWTSTALSAVVLSALAPPKLDRRLRDHAWLILLFGLVDAGMALPFFLALQSIPLGIAAAITFVGPLGVAVATSRRVLHFACIGVAALGVVLLTPALGGAIDPVGLGLSAVAAAAWAGFVPISKRAGRTFSGADGLTFGLWAATLLLLPFALAEGGLFQAGTLDLAGAIAVALLTVVLPMAMEYQALQHISARAYGVMMTLEPAIGALVGVTFLGQALGVRMSVAIACVTLAALGVTLSDRPDEP